MLRLRRAASLADFRAAAWFMDDLRRMDEEGCVARGFDVAEVAVFHADRTPEAMAATFAAPVSCLMMAEIGGHPVGCGGYVTAAPGLAEVVRFYVDASVRGQGVGSRLLVAVLDRAAAAGLPAARLETACFLTDAIRLYRRHGFVEGPPFRPLELAIDRLSVFMHRPADQTSAALARGEA